MKQKQLPIVRNGRYERSEIEQALEMGLKCAIKD